MKVLAGPSPKPLILRYCFCREVLFRRTEEEASGRRHDQGPKSILEPRVTWIFHKQ